MRSKSYWWPHFRYVFEVCMCTSSCQRSIWIVSTKIREKNETKRMLSEYVCATAYEWPPQALGVSNQRAIYGTYFDLPQTRPAIHLLPRQRNPFLPTTSFCDALYSDTFIYLLKSLFSLAALLCARGFFDIWVWKFGKKNMCARINPALYK